MMPCTRMPCLRHTMVRSAALALLLAAPASIVSAEATGPIAALDRKSVV